MMKKVLSVLLVCTVFALAGCGSSSSSGKSSSDNSVTTKKSEITVEQKKQASSETIRILNNMPKKTDEVEKMSWFTPWGTGSYPAEDAVYWYAGRKGNDVWLRAKIVNFTSSMGWVFWDKVIFSTTDKNWEYEIKDNFAGQTGGGKHTQVVMGGKYETLDVPLKDLYEGYKLLITGKNPIIRLKGKEGKYDYRLTGDDLEHIKTGIYLYDQLKVTNGKIVE